MFMKYNIISAILLLSMLFLFASQVEALNSSSVSITFSGSINYNSIPTLGWLHTDGVYVKDSQNRSVAMRALMNSGWSFPTAGLLQNAKAAGINFVTLTINRQGDGGAYPFDYNTQAAQMDAIINLCTQYGMYVTINHGVSTTRLQQMGITGITNIVNYETEFWSPIITRYRNNPTVVGVRLIDEPNLTPTPTAENQMWTQLIGNMRAINPNLLWFTHAIHVYRFKPQYFGMLPWQMPSQLPYPNIVMDGGMWISPTNSAQDFDPYYGTTTEAQAYARADQIVASVLAAMNNFRTIMNIPAGITPGTDDYYAPPYPQPAKGYSNARHYLIVRLAQVCNEGKYMMGLAAADYLLAQDKGLAVFNTVYPVSSRPYSVYW